MDSIDHGNKGIDHALTALIAEYNAIRAASLSRDQNENVLVHLQLLVVLAILAGLPSIFSKKYFLVLPLVSVVLSALASSERSQSFQLWQLASYENEILRPRLLILPGQAGSPAVVPDVIGGLWDWQHFHLIGAGGRAAKLIRVGGLTSSAVVHLTSIGILITFAELRILGKSTPAQEWILFLIALASATWSAAAYLFWLVDRRTQAKALSRR